ncbi:hypothetical protein N7493_007317 [Penicillium malachiteum]|uniref:Ubiquitin-like domain-containing protein n=1 Tax=Penicillium malachiteum TaxID=1324776 RepID=A0AAD6MUW9_9EURO|nr:hypothetical protein N7493_007317 [Penicillium malachiteum]
MGHYDLVGPNRDIILPDQWEAVLEPEWTVTMHMWPIPEKPVKPNESDNVASPSASSPKKAATGSKLKNGSNGLPAKSKSRSALPSMIMGVRSQPRLILPTQVGKARKPREDFGIKEANKSRRKRNFNGATTF